MSKGMATYTPVLEDDGYTILHARINLPKPMSKRSALMCMYRQDFEGGTEYAVSDRGNDALVDQFCEQIGKDVMMKNKLSYMKIYEKDGGIQFESVEANALGGKVPAFIEKWAAKQAPKKSTEFAEMLATGKVPDMDMPTE